MPCTDKILRSIQNIRETNLRLKSQFPDHTVWFDTLLSLLVDECHAFPKWNVNTIKGSLYELNVLKTEFDNLYSKDFINQPLPFDNIKEIINSLEEFTGV